jgi:DNA-binding transcriptional regulator YhcF (GntR family)
VTEKLDDVWFTRDYPVLREVTRRMDRGERYFPSEDVAEDLGIDPETAEQAAYALERTGYVTLDRGYGGPSFAEVGRAAYLTTGLHPSDDETVRSLIDALNAAAAETSDVEEKSKLQRIASGLGSLTSSVASGVLTAFLTAYVPH